MAERPNKSPELGEADKSSEVRVVRALPYALSASRDILDQLRNRQEPSCISVALSLKNKQSVPSPGALIPLGGKIEPGEDALKAAAREVREESMLVVAPWANENAPTQPILVDAFTYAIDNSDKNGGSYSPRSVSMVLLPCAHRDTLTQDFPNPEEDHIQSIEFVSAHDIANLISGGEYRGHALIGGMRVDDSEDAAFDPEQKQNQKDALTELMSHINELDQQYNQELAALLAANHGLNLSDSATLKNVYGQMLDTGMTMEAIDESFDRAYVQMEARVMCQAFEQDDLEHTPSRSNKETMTAVHEIMRSGTLGRELLEVLSLSAQVGEFSLDQTEGARAYGDMFDGIVSGMREDGVEAALLFDEGEDNVGVLARTEVYDRLHEGAIETFAQMTDQSIDYVKRVFDISGTIVPEFADAAFEGTQWAQRQIHEQLNEVNGGTLPKLMVLAKHGDSHLLRFEAQRRLLAFVKTLCVYKDYEQMSEAGSGPFTEAISDFYGKDSEVSDDLGVREQGGGNVRVRRNDDRVNVVDHKPTKPFSSYFRKSWEEDIRNIRDVFSVNIVDMSQHDLFDVPKRIERVSGEVKGFQKYLLETFGKQGGWNIEFIDQKNTFDSFIQQQNDDEGGKRAGSKGSKIVRMKYVARVTNTDGRSYCMEFAHMPYYYIPLEMGDGEYMGFAEKVGDDQDYGVRRLQAPSNRYHGSRSTSELWFPPSLYERFIDRTFVARR